MAKERQHTCCNKQQVKSGSWSKEEDELLRNYILTKGHQSWTTLPQRAGLQRCGKSCRLRWLNYLRPDIKHGSFSSDEARLIIRLHQDVGNKWAHIATHLPGRTDNEIKNFWNSTIKKRLLPQWNQQQEEEEQQQQLLQQERQQRIQQQQQFHMELFDFIKEKLNDAAADRSINNDKEWLTLAPPSSSRKGKEVAD